jgi:cytochrome c-type biogenesis protein CcmF
MPQLGSFTLLLALALAVYSLGAGALALHCKDDRLGETARRAGIACWAAVTIAALALVMAAFGNDFSVAYILHHCNRDLPIAYKFAALWSGQEGSLLLWAWLLSTYGLVMRLRYKVDP